MLRTRGALGVVAVGLLLALLPYAPSTGAPRTPVVEPVVPAARSFGVALPDVPGTMAPLEDLSVALGHRPDRVMWYVAWSLRSAFPTAQAAAVAATGATPVITWEPWDPAAGTVQPAYSLDAIAAGAHDAYLTSWARQARAYGRPVVLRFAHEMNGTWYPWAAGVNGNTAADHAAAWRHVVSLFNRQKATNVVWQWSANVSYPGSTPLASLYPGDRWVEEVGLDGYNWAGLLAGTTDTSFADVFGASAAEVRRLTALPLHVTETGTPEGLGDKAAWVAGMFETLDADPTYAGVTWFSFAKETDWRIDSSEASLAAFRAGLLDY